MGRLLKGSTYIFLGILFCMSACSNFSAVADASDASDLSRAQELYRKGETGTAAIIFSRLRKSMELLPEQRSLASEQFDSCINILHTDLAQTDVFGSLISQQKDNQVMQFLLYQYASLLESQRRYQDLVSVHRQLYLLSPTDAQKYTLARKLDTAGLHEEAYSLYTELLASKQYHDTVLRHMLETVHQLENANEYFNGFFNAEKEHILNNYGLFNVAITTLTQLGRYKDALAYSFVMSDNYPHLTDVLAHKLSSLYKENRITDADIANMIKRSEKPPTGKQRCLLSKIYGGANELDKAIHILGTDTSKEAVEYRALLYMQTENYDLARETYQALLKDYIPQPQWYQRLAEIELKTGRDEQGIDALRKYVSFSENKNFNSYFYVAKMFERYGLSKEAEQMYLEGKQIARNEKYAAVELIKYYIGQNEYRLAAIEILESQTRGLIKPAQLYFSLKNTFTEQTMVTDVIDQLEMLLDERKSQLSAEDKSNIYYCLYVFASEIGNYARSIPFFTSFFHLSPDKHNELMAVVGTLEEAGFYKEGSDLLDLLPADSPVFGNAVQKRAELLIKQGQAKESLRILQEYPRARNNYLYARALLESGYTDQAADVLRNIVKPSASCILLNAKIAMLNRQFLAAADTYATIGKNAGAEYISAVYGLALAHLFDGKFDKALENLEYLCRLYAHSKEARDAVEFRKLIALIGAFKNEQLTEQWIKAEFSLWADNIPEAIEGFEKLTSLNPSAPYIQDIRLRLFRLYVRNNQYDKAFSKLSDIARDNPDSALGAWAMHLRIELREKIAGSELDELEYVELLSLYPDSYDSDIVRKKIETQRTGHALTPPM